jgi:hypothetical protein
VIDEYVNRGKVNALTAWGAAVGLMLMAWCVALWAGSEAGWRCAVMLAFTSCITSAFAAVLHIRCYAVRVAGLVRATSSIQHERPRPVRDL